MKESESWVLKIEESESEVLCTDSTALVRCKHKSLLIDERLYDMVTSLMTVSVQCQKKKKKERALQQIVAGLFGNCKRAARTRSARYFTGRNRSWDWRHAVDRTNPLPWQPAASEMFSYFFFSSHHPVLMWRQRLKSKLRGVHSAGFHHVLIENLFFSAVFLLTYLKSTDLYTKSILYLLV
jgi:hypothetical protein